MSIVTKTGDQGTTGLMYGRRVPKTHARIEACGTIDELNAALGLARAACEGKPLQELLASASVSAAAPASGANPLLSIQKDLVALMGELATAREDYARYLKDGYPAITSAHTAGLEQRIAQLEAQNLKFQGWATPGANGSSAQLDLARTVCRRAERRVCALYQTGELENPQILVYLNRLADLLWLLARKAETV